VKEVIRRAKLRLLQMHYESRVGHLGGNLSSLDVLMTLYHRVLKPDDLFVLSKGHSAGALYVALWSIGRLDDADLREFHGDHTRLAGHPPACGIPEVVFATGSLGHGFGLAAGLALGKRLQAQPGRVFCLTSDGEWNEGSNWEALIFSAHRQLGRLTVVVDLNGLQGFGTTKEVADLGRLADKFASFGFDTCEIDGHDTRAIEQALEQASSGPPRAVLARTVKGNGVSFMENRMEWHYLPLNDAQYRQASEEVGRS
jgi:transketolase